MEKLTTTEILIYAGIVILVIATGLFMYRKEILFSLRKKETTGKIVNWMSASEKGKKFFYPMVEFETSEFGKVTFRAEERCENNPMFPPGTDVKIYYLSTDKEQRKVEYPS
jgi:hypothetical protein